MVYHAPYGNPQDGTDAPPKPPVVRERITASKEFFQSKTPDDLMTIAQRIISHHWADISQFILGMRQTFNLPAAYKFINYADLDIEYQRLGKQETISITVYPDQETTAEAQGQVIVDVNFDGYVAWVHWQDPTKINGASFIIGPFDIYLNSYLIAESFQPEAPCGGYVILFGKTALKAESYQDDDGRTNNQLINSNPQDKIQEVQPRPGWGQRPEMPAPDNSGTIPAFTKELGYWLWDVADLYSPTNYIYEGSVNGVASYLNWTAATHNTGPTPMFSAAKWFQFADKSPLQNEGGNTLSWQTSPKSKTGEVLVSGFAIAEFYSRSDYRSVQKSWQFTANPGDNLSLNDSPLAWVGSYSTGGFYNGGSVSFDLTPGHENTDYYGSGDPDGGPGLSDMDQAKLDQWSAEVRALTNAYNNTVAIATGQWRARWSTPAALMLLNQANNVYGFWKFCTDANGNKLPSIVNDYAHAAGVGHVEVYGPIQSYLWNWNSPFATDGGAVTQGVARWFAYFSLVTQQVIFVDTGSNPGIDFSNSPQGAFATVLEMFAFADNYVKDPSNPINQEQTDYTDNVLSIPTPNYPTRPKVGDDYTKFSYRDVTIAGNEWDYPSEFSTGSA